MALDSSNQSDNLREQAINSEKLMKNFIGRELYFDVLDAKIEALASAQDDNDYFVLGLSGKAGRGKSFLSEKVIYNNATNTRGSKVISINFSKEFRSSYKVIDILIEMRNSLVRLHNFKFKEFDAVIHFIEKKYATTIELHSYESSTNDAKKFSLSAIKSILDNFTWGLTSVVIDQVGNSLKNSSVNNDNIIITDEQVKHLLHRMFIKDMKQNTAKKYAPIIIIFDCFEDFRGDFDWLSSGEDDSAVGFGYGLWHSIPKTLWVISGREPLALTHEDKWDAQNFLSLDPLSRFTLEETALYLERNSNLVGEEYQDVHHAIYEYTEGSPLLLDLARKLINDNQLNTKEAILTTLNTESFSEKREQLMLQKYLKYLHGQNSAESDARATLIKTLVLLEWWTLDGNDVLISEILPKLGKSIDIEEQLEEIIKLNFVDTYTLDGSTVYRLDASFIDIIRNGQIDRKPIISTSFLEKILEILVNRANGYLFKHQEIQRVVRLTKHLYDGTQRFEALETNLREMIGNMQAQGEVSDREALLYLQQMFYGVMDNAELLNSEAGQAAFAQYIEMVIERNIVGLDSGIADILAHIEEPSLNLSANVAEYYQMIGKYEASVTYCLNSHPLLRHLYENRGNNGLMFGASYKERGITIKTMQEQDELSAVIYIISDADIFKFLEVVERLITNKLLLSDNEEARQLSVIFFRLFSESLFKIKFAPYIVLTVSHAEALSNIVGYLDEIKEIEANDSELFYSLINTQHAIVLTEAAQIIAKRLRRSQKGDSEYFQLPQEIIDFAVSISQNSETDAHDVIQLTNNIAFTSMFLEYRSEAARDIFKSNYEKLQEMYGEDSYHTFKAAYYYIYCLNQFQEYKKTRALLYPLIEKVKPILGENHIFIGDLYKQLGVTYLVEDYEKVTEYYALSYKINRDNVGELAQETLDRHFRWLENEYRLLDSRGRTDDSDKKYITLRQHFRQLYLLMNEYAKFSDDLGQSHKRVQAYLMELG